MQRNQRILSMRQKLVTGTSFYMQQFFAFNSTLYPTFHFCVCSGKPFYHTEKGLQLAWASSNKSAVNTAIAGTERVYAQGLYCDIKPRNLVSGLTLAELEA